MKQNRYQSSIQTLKKWQQEKPLWFIWAGISVGLLLYYMIVIATLNTSLLNTQDNISADKTKMEWMAKAAQEIMRLRQVAPHEKAKTQLAAFAIVNKAINDKGWNDLVSDVHQLDENRVQMNLKSISFNELINWLQQLYDSSGVYVMEANLEKVQPGVVSVSLVLQKDAAN